VKITRIKIQANLDQPVKLLHIADTHLTLSDKRDEEKIQDLAQRRGIEFENDGPLTGPGCVMRGLDEALEYVQHNDELLLYSGDLLDFITVRNIETVKEKFLSCDCFIAVGNHDFCSFMGVGYDSKEDRKKYWDTVQSLFLNDIGFAAREYRGLNLIALDNSDYQFTVAQIELFKAEAAKNLPILLLAHTPLFTIELYERQINKGVHCAYAVGCPEAKMDIYPEYCRREQTPTPVTLEFLDCLYRTKCVKAVLCGHMHYDDNFTTMLPNDIPQHIVGGNYKGCANEYIVGQLH